MNWVNFRTVVEEAPATKSVDHYAKLFPRFADQWEGFKWLVARRPKDISMRKIIDGVEHNLSHRSGDPQNRIPELAVLFTYTDNEVFILDVFAELRDA